MKKITDLVLSKSQRKKKIELVFLKERKIELVLLKEKKKLNLYFLSENKIELVLLKEKKYNWHHYEGKKKLI